jgi:nicotinamide riboside kinase
LKILVTGAYSTGKSTLIRGLAEALEASGTSTLVLSDSSREISFPLNREQGHDTTLWLLSWQISKERTAAEIWGQKSVIICDRGVPDILAHNLEAGTRAQGLSNQNALSAAQDWCKTYDLSLFSLINDSIPIEEDGIRVADPNYRRLMETFAQKTVELLQPCVTLPFSEQERIKFSLSEIAELLLEG